MSEIVRELTQEERKLLTLLKHNPDDWLPDPDGRPMTFQNKHNMFNCIEIDIRKLKADG